MTATPYTASITATLGIDEDSLLPLARTSGLNSAIGECAKVIQTTIWDMESAERTANHAMSSLRDAAEKQAANLAGNGTAFDPSWLLTYATRANEANAKLTAGVERLRTFKHLLDVLTKEPAAA